MANEGKQIPANFPIEIIAGNDWGVTVTFTDDIATDTFTAAISRSGSEDIAITCTPNTGTKSVALSFTDTQTSTLSGVYTYYFDRTRSSYTLTLISGSFTVTTL